jgi:hypothetical protein
MLPPKAEGLGTNIIFLLKKPTFTKHLLNAEPPKNEEFP